MKVLKKICSLKIKKYEFYSWFKDCDEYYINALHDLEVLNTSVLLSVLDSYWPHEELKAFSTLLDLVYLNTNKEASKRNNKNYY